MREKTSHPTDWLYHSIPCIPESHFKGQNKLESCSLALLTRCTKTDIVSIGETLSLTPNTVIVQTPSSDSLHWCGNTTLFPGFTVTCNEILKQIPFPVREKPENKATCCVHLPQGSCSGLSLTCSLSHTVGVSTAGECNPVRKVFSKSSSRDKRCLVKRWWKLVTNHTTYL